MQAFVAKHQRRLDEYIEDAWEWDVADAAAAAEEQTDWALLCSWAERPCLHGADCPYHVAATSFCHRNQSNFAMVD